MSPTATLATVDRIRVVLGDLGLAAPSPAAVLAAVLEVEGWTQTELAARCEVKQGAVGMVVRGHRGVGPGMARSLELGTGIPAEVWATLSALHAVRAR